MNFGKSLTWGINMSSLINVIGMWHNRVIFSDNSTLISKSWEYVDCLSLPPVVLQIILFLFDESTFRIQNVD